jgi:hypothetical protein
MRFVQPVVMVVGAVMYTLIFAFFDDLNTYYTIQWNFVIAGAWNLLFLVATVIAIVDSIRRIRAKKTRQLATDALVVKLAAIPFFILNYVMLVFLFFLGGAALLFGGPLLWVVVAVGSGLTYLAILSTSVYVWAAIAQLRRDRIIGTRLTVLYAILSLIPVTDVAASVLLFGHYRRRPRLALVAILLSIGLLALVFGLIITSVNPAFKTGYDPITLGGYILAIVGMAVILPTAVVSIVRRSTLRAEAQRATVAREPSADSETSDRVPAG